MNQISKQARIDAAEKFFNLLFGAVNADKFGYLWTKQDKATYPFKVATAAARHDMAVKAIELNDAGFDVYVGVNLMDEPPAPQKRVTTDKVTLQTATVTDIDIEGGRHISEGQKVYTPNFATARAFLPFKPSLLINSGFGLHAYCLYQEPIAITADNREDCINRNKNFISVIQSRAGVFGGTVDGVHDLPRILRVAGTFNYSGGRDNAPLCHVVEVNDTRFTPASLDDALKPFLPKPAALPKQEEGRPARQSANFHDGDEPTALERIDAMLAVIPPAELSYDEWLKIGMAIKNEGGGVGIWERWSRNDERYKPGECERKWQGFTHGGVSIACIHDIAKRHGYSEYDYQRDWHAERRQSMTKQRRGFDNTGGDVGVVDKPLINSATEPAQDSKPRDALLNFLFSGDASDLDFGNRLERVIGDRVRWLTDSERWLVYDSGVWTRGSEKNSCVLPLVREVANLINQHADSNDERKLAARLKSTRKMATALTALKSCTSILIKQDDLDTHNELLNVQNGVVDLTTGKLLAADPKLLLSRQCRAAYDPKAHSELVDKFFRDIQPDEATRAGLIRWLAYCLTGETCEERFLVWHGNGQNGKGVLSATMLELLGNYGVGLTPRALLKSNRPADANAATASLNGLDGTRFAISEELPADAELDVSLVKNLTGGDRINLRGLYGEYRTVINRAKINVSGNYLPRIENTTDKGLLRRLLNMPFTVNFRTPANPADDTLKRKMMLPENLSALLAILVRDAVKWYRRDDGGLIVSSQMSAETQKLLEQNNFVADFIADNYTTENPNATVKIKDFIDELKVAYPFECRRFTKRADLINLIVAASGGKISTSKDSHNGNIFKGIGKLADHQPVDDDDAPTADQCDFGGEPIDPRDIPPIFQP